MHKHVLEKAVAFDSPLLQGDFASIAKMKLEQAKTMFQKWEDIPTTLLLAWVWRCFYPQVENTTEK